MKKILVVLFLLASTVLAQSPRDMMVLPRKPKTKLDFEAHRVAKKMWDSVLTKCGESYFTVDTAWSGGPRIYEIRGLAFKMYWGAVSEPNRLNGLEWSGINHIEAKAVRMYEGAWATWTKQPFAVSVEKNNGKWVTSWQYWMKLEKIACANIPE